MGIDRRIKDINELTRNLDISPTMVKNATEKYINVGKYLETKGFECDIFPIGSFATGTVVRPFYNDKDQDYDLDFICLVNKNRDVITPKETKLLVYEELSKSDIYKRILADEEWEKCWTLEYAEINGVGFNMDIVPAAHISNDINPLMITDKKNSTYEWVISQPKALIEWFNNINQPFLEFGKDEERKVLFEKYRDIYASIEEIPETLERSSLQRVIQLLKRHRDIFYSKAGKEYKVASIIITTLVAEIAEPLNPSISFYELLNCVVNELALYSKYNKIEESTFVNTYAGKLLIKKVDDEWIIKNPIDSGDNLAEPWKVDGNIAEMFFKWIEQVKKDFVGSMEMAEEKYLASIGSAFGLEYFQKSKVRERYEISKPKVINTIHKPYGEE